MFGKLNEAPNCRQLPGENKMPAATFVPGTGRQNSVAVARPLFEIGGELAPLRHAGRLWRAITSWQLPKLRRERPSAVVPLASASGT